MKKETIEKAAREYAEDMIGRQDASNPLPPELRGYLMQLIQNCFKNGAIVAINSLVEMMATTQFLNWPNTPVNVSKKWRRTDDERSYHILCRINLLHDNSTCHVLLFI